MNEPNNHTESWQDCPAGELEQLATSLRSQRQRRTLTKAALPAAALILILAAGGFIALQFRGADKDGGVNPVPVRLTCRKVGPLLEDYRDGKLEANLAKQVEAHLQKCPHCRKRYEQIKAQTGSKNQQPSTVAHRNNCPCCQRNSLALVAAAKNR